MSDEIAVMFTNLEKKTGKPKSFWIEAVKAAGLEKHGQMVAMLKEQYGIGHGYANMIALEARGAAAAHQDAASLVEAQYRGKEHLRPIYDRIAEVVTGFGADVEISPKKAGVSLRRNKQFALVEPATKIRVDVGINLKGHPGTDRLKVAGGMCTHKVSVADASEVDAELIGWIKQAYEAAG